MRQQSIMNELDKDISMTSDYPDRTCQELRSETRMTALEFSSVAFKPATADLEYHFRLRDFSASGLGILVKKDSDLLRHIHVGDILEVQYHQGNATPTPRHFKVEIRHISLPAHEKPAGHLVVGLKILEKPGS